MGFFIMAQIEQMPAKGTKEERKLFTKVIRHYEMADLIYYNVEKAKSEVEMLERDALISKATMDEKIKIIEEEAVRANLTNLLLKAQKDNTEAGTKKTLQDIKTQQAQIDKWAKEIAQGWMALGQIS